MSFNKCTSVYRTKSKRSVEMMKNDLKIGEIILNNVNEIDKKKIIKKLIDDINKADGLIIAIYFINEKYSDYQFFNYKAGKFDLIYFLENLKHSIKELLKWPRKTS